MSPEARDYDPDLARLIFDEYQLRQTHYWRSSYRLGFSIITLNVAPHFKVNDFAPLKDVGEFILGVALTLCVAVTWLLHTEYLRLRNVRISYNTALPPKTFSTKDGEQSFTDRLIWVPIGYLTTFSFLLGFGLLSVGNYYFIRKLLWWSAGAE